MIQEDQEILLIDLCAMLPYEIIVKVNDTQGIIDKIDISNERIFVTGLNPFLYGGAKAHWFTVNGDKIFPYLRPMSSMTEEEREEYDNWHLELESGRIKDWKIADYINWLNAHHFDYHGLIEKGLALEAPEGMYNV